MRYSHASCHAEAHLAMTAAEYRRLRRMLQRERQKGLLALDLLADVATQSDRVVDESDVSGIDESVTSDSSTSRPRPVLPMPSR